MSFQYSFLASKWKQAVVYLQVTFTFDMASNATPREKLSEELQYDTNIISLRRTLKYLEAEKLYWKDIFADI